MSPGQQPGPMGKGGLNRVLLTSEDATSNPDVYVLPRDDGRATHIRTVLYDSSPLNLRIAVAQRFLHDAAIVKVQDDESVRIEVPPSERQNAPQPPPVALIVAMQRPKVIGRVLEAAAALGVSVICIVAADKVEKSYWDCKLFRPDSVNSPRTASAYCSDYDNNDRAYDGECDTKLDQPVRSGLEQTVKVHKKRIQPESDLGNGPLSAGLNSTPTSNDNKECSWSVPSALPGRPRGARNHPHLNARERSGELIRRVDGLPAVKRRLELAVQQASTDAYVPTVLLERRGLSAVLNPDHQLWGYVPWTCARVVAHPYPHGGAPLLSMSSVVSEAIPSAAVLAIGPEGGWTSSELDILTGAGFAVAGLGERVLRSETAVVVSLGLVHEGLRLRKARADAQKTKCSDILEDS